MPRIEAPTVAEHSAMRRAQVIQAAAEVLAERGRDRFTPAAVAQRAGLARSSIYQYYPSTEALFGAAMTELLTRSRDRMLGATRGLDTPAQRVEAYVAAAFDDAADGHGTVADLSGVQMPEHCREGIRALHRQLLDPLLDALETAGTADPQLWVALVQGSVSAGVSAVAHGADRDAARTATVTFVLRGLGLADA